MATAHGDAKVRRDVDALFAAYLAGDSLSEIGSREGISGERVRQLFRAAGFPRLDSAHTNRQRSQQRRAALREPLITAFRSHHSVAVAATVVGCSVGLASDILVQAGEETDVNRAWVAARSKPTVTAEFCIAALREAADRCEGRLTESRYQAFIRSGASTDGQAWPWPSTILRRLGVARWNESLDRAGVPHSALGSGPRGCPDQSLLQLAADLQRELGRPPTPNEYSAAAKAGGLPGAQSAIRRFRAWESFVGAAAQVDQSLRGSLRNA